MKNEEKKIICEKLKKYYLLSAMDYFRLSVGKPADAPNRTEILPVSDKASDLVSEIWDDLNLKETYLFPQDFLDKCMALFIELNIKDAFEESKTKEEQNAELDSIISKVYDRLQEPNTSYSFTVPLTSGGAVFYDFKLGGEGEFRIAENEDRDSEFQILIGNINAPTDHRAIYEIARCVEEVIGVGHVLGIFVFMRPVFLPSRPLFIKVDPWQNVDLQPQVPHGVESIVNSAFAVIPNLYLSDLEKHAAAAGNYEKATERLTNLMTRLFSSPHGQSRRVRHSCRLFIQAVASHDYGFALSNMFMVLEGILLNDSKSDVQARLVEAIAYSIGHTSDGRDAVRKEIKRLYELRSRYVHTGNSGANYNDFTRCADIVSEILRKEIDDFVRYNQE